MLCEAMSRTTLERTTLSALSQPSHQQNKSGPACFAFACGSSATPHVPAGQENHDQKQTPWFPGRGQTVIRGPGCVTPPSHRDPPFSAAVSVAAPVLDRAAVYDATDSMDLDPMDQAEQESVLPLYDADFMDTAEDVHAVPPALACAAPDADAMDLAEDEPEQIRMNMHMAMPGMWTQTSWDTKLVAGCRPPATVVV